MKNLDLSGSGDKGITGKSINFFQKTYVHKNTANSSSNLVNFYKLTGNFLYFFKSLFIL